MDIFLRKYFWVFYLLVITTCSLLLGKSVGTVLGANVIGMESAPVKLPTMSTPVFASNTKRDIMPILDRNIFCATCAPIVENPSTSDQGVDPQVRGNAKPQRTGLSLQLIGLMVSEEEQWSMALVRELSEEGKPYNLYRRGDFVKNGQTQVLQVTEQRVYLMTGSRIEYLDYTNPNSSPSTGPIAMLPMPGGPGSEMTGLEKDIEKGVRCSSPNNCEIDRQLLDKVLANTTSLATSARIIPAPPRDGKPGGFKIYPMGPNSVWSKIGIRGADIIKSINGLDMGAPDKALEAFVKLRSASHLSVVLERGGETVNLDYTIR